MSALDGILDALVQHEDLLTGGADLSAITESDGAPSPTTSSDSDRTRS